MPSSRTGYVLVELSFSLPQVLKWSLVWRIHHSSEVFGLFNGVHGGSNAMPHIIYLWPKSYWSTKLSFYFSDLIVRSHLSTQ